MGENIMKSLKYFVLLLMLFAVFFLSTGCKPVAQLYIGNVYKDATTFPLDVTQTTPAELKTFEIQTSFTYKKSDQSLSISGTVAMGNHYQFMYETINVFDLFLFFLDDNNRVIDGTQLYHAANADSSDTFPFKQDIAVPTTATQIALGYEASFGPSGADDNGHGGGGRWIYHLPLSSAK
jgi:hypothetical protein